MRNYRLIILQSDEEDNNIIAMAVQATTAPSNTKAVAKKAPVKAAPLSKKERELQRQKELEDLDALLSTFKASAAVDADPSGGSGEATAADDEGEEAGAPSSGDKKKKPKKKKASAAAAATPTVAASSEKSSEQSTEATLSPAELAEILKQRAATKSKGSAKSSVSAASDPKAAAVAEARRREQEKKEKEKKKKDKNKYSEMAFY